MFQQFISQTNFEFYNTEAITLSADATAGISVDLNN